MRKRENKQVGRSRRPTYRTATRLARLVHELPAHPHGWSFGAIQDALGISERTLLCYLKACREELVDANSHPLLETVRRGERRLLRVVTRRGDAEASRTRRCPSILPWSCSASLRGPC